jgi:hypothetical protein
MTGSNQKPVWECNVIIWQSCFPDDLMHLRAVHAPTQYRNGWATFLQNCK